MAEGLPDYVLDANAVLKDTNVTWRHGQPPDYSKTRVVWSESELSNLLSISQYHPQKNYRNLGLAGLTSTRSTKQPKKPTTPRALSPIS